MSVALFDRVWRDYKRFGCPKSGRGGWETISIKDPPPDKCPYLLEQLMSRSIYSE